jgi:hypothetical protein
MSIEAARAILGLEPASAALTLFVTHFGDPTGLPCVSAGHGPSVP